MIERIVQRPPTSPGSIRGTYSWLFALLLVALAATVVTSPMWFLGNASGHDFQFHIASWMDAAGQWRQGTIYPRWAQWSNWGFGEPRFIFYPPASWTLGALISLALPWRAVPGVYVWLVLILAGMSMWRLTRQWLPGSQAVAAALFFALNPYNLAVIYYRSDFAELLAGAFLPLLFHEALQVIDGNRHHIPLLSGALAAIWLSNAPEGVIATYLLVLVLIVGCVRRRSLSPLLLGGIALAGGFSLAAFYIMPAALEKRWVQIAQAIASNLRPDHNFIFAQGTDPEFVLFNWKISGLALGMMLATAIAAVFVARKRRELNGIWSTLLSAAIASITLMFRPSIFVWRSLPELAFVQFPWRWLESLAVVFAFFLAAGIGICPRRWGQHLAIAATLVMIGSTGALMSANAWWDSGDIPFIGEAIRTGHGYEGTDEYAPLGCNRYGLPGAIPDDSGEVPATPPTPRIEQLDASTGTLSSGSAPRLREEKWLPEDKIFFLDSVSPTTVALRLLNYPAWETWMDGKPFHSESGELTARLLIHLPAGQHRVEVRFRRTSDREAGGIISGLSAIALLLFGWGGRRQREY